MKPLQAAQTDRLEDFWHMTFHCRNPSPNISQSFTIYNNRMWESLPWKAYSGWQHFRTEVMLNQHLSKPLLKLLTVYEIHLVDGVHITQLSSNNVTAPFQELLRVSHFRILGVTLHRILSPCLFQLIKKWPIFKNFYTKLAPCFAKKSGTLKLLWLHNDRYILITYHTMLFYIKLEYFYFQVSSVKEVLIVKCIIGIGYCSRWLPLEGIIKTICCSSTHPCVHL